MTETNKDELLEKLSNLLHDGMSNILAGENRLKNGINLLKEYDETRLESGIATPIFTKKLKALDALVRLTDIIVHEGW